MSIQYFRMKRAGGERAPSASRRDNTISGCVGAFLAMACIFPVPALLAATLEYRVDVTGSATYSDNLELAPSKIPGENENDPPMDPRESGWIYEVTPGLVLSTRGERITASLEYRLRTLSYQYNNSPDDDDEEESGAPQPPPDPTDEEDSRYEREKMHRLRFISNTQLLRDRLFFDANAGRDQILINPFAPGASQDRVLNASGNLADQRTLTLSPYLMQSFGAGATALVRYGYDEVKYDDIDTPEDQEETRFLDSETRRVEATFDTSASDNPLSLEIAYNRDDIAFTDKVLRITQREVGLEEGSITLGYQLMASLNVFGTWGDENYTVFQRENTNTNESEADEPPEIIIVQREIDESFGEPFREFGLRWAPGNSTSIEVARGKRFFGRTGRFEFNHNRPNRVLTARYQEDVTIDPRQQLLSQNVIRVNEDGVLEEQNLLLPGDFDIDEITPYLYIDKMATLSYTHQFTRSTITVEGFRGERIYFSDQLNDSSEKVSGASAGFEYRLGRNARLGFSSDVRRLDDRKVRCNDGSASPPEDPVEPDETCLRWLGTSQENPGDTFVRHALTFNWQYARQQRLTLTRRYLARKPGPEPAAPPIAGGDPNADNVPIPGYREHAWIVAVNIEF